MTDRKTIKEKIVARLTRNPSLTGAELRKRLGVSNKNPALERSFHRAVNDLLKEGVVRKKHENYELAIRRPPISSKLNVKGIVERIKTSSGQHSKLDWSFELFHIARRERIAPVPSVLEDIHDLLEDALKTNSTELAASLSRTLYRALELEGNVKEGSIKNKIFSWNKGAISKFVVNENINIELRFDGLLFLGMTDDCTVLDSFFEVLERARPNEQLDRVLGLALFGDTLTAPLNRNCRKQIMERLYDLKNRGVQTDRVGKLIKASHGEHGL